MSTTRPVTCANNGVTNFLHLFIMDLVRNFHGDFNDYQQFEPNFSDPYLRAFIYAFKQPANARFDHELLKKINAISLSHLPEVRAGEYRFESGNFNVGFKDVKSGGKTSLVPCFSATADGLRQFMKYWISDHPNSLHGFMLESKQPESVDSYGVCVKNGKLLFFQVSQKNGIHSNRHEPYD